MNAQPELTILLSRDEIKMAVSRLAEEISREYHDKNPLLIGILTGAFVFLADLARSLDFPLEIAFIGASSYGEGTRPGALKITAEVPRDIAARHVLVVEDIVDTGHCTSFVLEHLGGMSPASLKLCSLLDKPQRRQEQVKIDYLGFTVPDKFLVGYGLDWNQKYRYLPDICYLEF